MKTNDWDPEQYLKFNKERLQPSIDLVARIDFEEPKNIIDIGCGPGNSTQILVHRWPDANITGVDNSPSMIEKAKNDFPNQKWLYNDAGREDLIGKYDIIYSNATIQWIPDHSKLLKKFFNLLTDKGLLAIQIPLFWDMPIGRSILSIAIDERWHSRTSGIHNLFTIHDYNFYHNQLSELFNSIEIWQTDYFHILNSHSAILEMIKSTGLKPYLDAFENETEMRVFQAEVLNEIVKEYPLLSNGTVLFPFKRLFFIAKNK